MIVKSGYEHWMIKDVAKKGNRFRTNDWIERVSVSLARLDANNRLYFTRKVRPCLIEGEKTLLVSKDLERTNPDAYAFIMDFAKENNLLIQEDRRKYSRRR